LHEKGGKQHAMPCHLDRDLGRRRFADAGYAMEELVAEISASRRGAPGLPITTN
jgi:antirestriction protein ArdC